MSAFWQLVKDGNAAFFHGRFEGHELFFTTRDSAAAVLDRLAPVMLKQVHSDTIIDLDRDPDRVGDGMVAIRPVPMAIKVADCLPVFLFGRDRIGMIHCGWRSIAAGIVAQALRRTGPCRYVLGACIGPCCYEVKTDVATVFSDRYGRAITLREGKTYLDLKAIVREQLSGQECLGDLDRCTRCHPEYFHSYRRGDKDARNYAVLAPARDTISTALTGPKPISP